MPKKQKYGAMPVGCCGLQTWRTLLNCRKAGESLIGLFFLTTVAFWLFACIWLSIKTGNSVANLKWRLPIKLLMLMSLPFGDEVIGKYQFEELRRANGIENADVSRARRKKVKVEYGGRTLVQGTILPIKESDVSFRDAATGEVLIHHKNYYSSGGWLMRNTWLNLGSNHPMLFDGSTCDIRKEQQIFKSNSTIFTYK